MQPKLECPVCGYRLDLSGPLKAICTHCPQQFPMTMGIPDLRGLRAPNPKAEATIVAKMLESYAHVDFSELLDIRLKYDPNYGNLIGHEVPYMLAQDLRGCEMATMFQDRLEQYFGAQNRGIALDIGCGSGASLIPLARNYEWVAGIDPSLPDLILARKALDAERISNVQLVQAFGQRIPYSEQSFDYINALNVFEHIFDVDSVMGECQRLLRPGGMFAADSRNRFDLFLPEPHVRVRWVGFLPRRWASRYVHWRRGVSYESTCLLSYWQLQRSLKKHFGQGYQIVFPRVSAYGGPQWVEVWLAYVERLPVLRTLILWVFPSHLALAKQ